MQDSIAIMDEYFQRFIKKAMENMKDDGFIAPVCIAVTPDREHLQFPYGAAFGVHTTEQWADIIRSALKQFHAEFYVLVMDSWVSRSNENTGTGETTTTEALVVYAVHKTGITMNVMVPYMLHDNTIEFSDPEPFTKPTGILGDNLFTDPC